MFTKVRVFALVANNQYTNIALYLAVDDRVGKASERVRSTLFVRRSSEFRKLFEQ